MPQNVADLAANLVNLLLSLDGDKLTVAVNEAWAEGRARSGQFCPEPAAMDDAIHGILARLREKGWAGDPPRRPRQPRRNCGYGGGVIVAANGDVHPCPILHRPVGNVRTNALADLMARLQQIYFETSVDHVAECADCDLRYICGGGCRVRNLRERGDPRLPTCTEESRDAIYRRLLASDEA